MLHADAMPDSMTPDRHKDSIYCEAACPPEDVYYEGSEDEDYDDHITRKRRYEAAGRRYLEGNVPLLISAALRGPFDKESGWLNPWRSKSCSSNAPRPSLAARQHNRGRASAVSLGEQPAETQDSLECHLPSPESLKQAPCTEQHPYLEGDELAAVHNWRTEIPPPALVKDGFWVVSPLSTTSKKRRASQPSWLKTIASKRRRMELMEEGSINTPLPRRSRTMLGLDNSNSSNPHISTNESFNSAPACLNSSTRKSVHIRQDDDMRAEAREMDDDDELVCAPEISFSSAPARLVSPSKRLTPRRRSHQNKHSIDEISQDQMAAASLSSPVSQRARLRAPSQPQVSGAQIKANQGITATNPPAHGRIIGSSPPLSRARTSISSLSDVAMVDAGNGTSSADETSSEELQNFETQEDQSFCFKVLKSTKESHLEPTAELDPAPVSQEDNDSTDVQSVSSSSTDSSTDENINNVEAIHGHESQQSNANRHQILERPTGTVSPESSASDATSQLDGTTFVQFTQAAMDAIVDQPVPQVNLKAALCEAAASKCEAVFGEDGDGSHVQSESMAKDGHMFDQQPIMATETIDEYSEPGSEGDEIDHPKESGESQDYVGAIEAENRSSGSSISGRTSLPGNETASRNEENCSSSSSTSGNLPDNETVSENSEVLECATPSETQQARKSAIGATTGNGEDAIIKTPGASQGRGLAGFSLKNILVRYASPLRRLSGLGVHSGQYSQQDPQQDLITSQIPDVGVAERCHSNMAMSFNKGTSQHDSDQTSTETDTESAITDSEEGDTRSLSRHDPDSSSVPSPVHPSSTTADAVAHGVTEVPRNSATAETPQKATSLSQQSPWVQSQFPGQAVIPVLSAEQVQGSTPEKAGDSGISITANTQSPWTGETENRLMERNHDVPSLDTVDNNTSSSRGNQGRTAQPSPGKTVHPSQPSTQSGAAWPSTPEPQFAFASFASFMTPSPQRSRCNKPSSWRDSGRRLPSTQGILASAMKNPWGRSTSCRRVSWAPLPHEQENCAPPGPSTASSPCRERAASPPPTTPLSELPTSEDSKFHNHFAAVANRTDGVRQQRLLPTASQQRLYSPEPHAMADQFLAADDVGNSEATNNIPVEDGPEEPDVETDPMDIVGDMFNEMGDFLQTWDVDAELDEARKADKTPRGSTRLGIEAQSPW